MMTTTDILVHLPLVNAGPWKRVAGCYERYVSFTCLEYRKRRHATLRVYNNGEGASMITVKLDGRTRELSVGEHTDPFNVANELLLAFERGCCHEVGGDAR